jgi:hypothetical protein
MAVMRYTVRWNGFTGAPGFTNLHFLFGSETLAERDDSASAVRALFVAMQTYMPTGVNVTFPTEVDIFDEESGSLISTLPVSSLATVSGTGSTAYSSVTGGVISWGTNVIINGRRLRGRTFMVPLGSTFYTTDGTPIESARTAIATAAATFIANSGGPPFGVWSRPKVDQVGVLGVATTASVPDKAAVLKSRRD